MKNFLNYAKNRFLYNLIRILIIVGIGFLLGSCQVKAATVGSFGGIDINSTKIISGNNGYSQGQGHYVSPSSNAKSFIEYTFCLTDVLDFYSIAITGSISGDVITVSQPNVSCTIDNSTNGFIEKVYINVLSYDDAGNGNYGIILDSSIFNRHNYAVSSKLLSVSSVDTINYDSSKDIINQNNQIIEQGQQTNEKLDDLNDTLKDNFNDCRDSVNLYNPDETYIDGVFNQDIALNYYYDLKVGETYTFSTPHPWTSINVYDSNNNQIRSYGRTENSYKQSVTIQNGDSYLILVFNAGENTNISTYDFTGVQFQKGNVATSYEPYGEEICKNKIDATNDKLDQAEETRKGIWETIKDLPNAFLNMLKGLFIPEDDYFGTWFDNLKTFFEDKLGFLATPFTVIVDFVNRFLNINSSENIIINIPDISVPNFEDYVIIHATTFNWSELLKSKDTLNTLWQLYLSFIDVILILKFINLCENKYNRIFGGDVSNDN